MSSHIKNLNSEVESYLNQIIFSYLIECGSYLTKVMKRQEAKP